MCDVALIRVPDVFENGLWGVAENGCNELL